MDTTMLIPLLERLGWTSLQTVLLVALVYGVCRALPSLSAATRCRLWWLVSLQAVLGLFWSQPLQLAWLPAPQAVAMTATDVAADLVYPLAPEASAQLLAAMPVPAADVPAVALWAVALAALWASGVLLMALRTFGEWRRCRALLAAAYPCEDEALVQALQLASDAHGVRPAPRLWMSTQVDAPQLVGPFRPVLLLPAGDNALQGDALDLALTHELQHLQRRDLQWGLLPALAQHLFFFHPLLRLSVREYAQAREEAVDAAVVGQHGASRQAYGRLLLQLGVAPQPHLGVASAAPNTTSLKRRLLSLQPRRACPRILAMALTAVVVLVGVAPMRLVAAPVPPAPPRRPWCRRRRRLRTRRPQRLRPRAFRPCRWRPRRLPSRPMSRRCQARTMPMWRSTWMSMWIPTCTVSIRLPTPPPSPPTGAWISASRRCRPTCWSMVIRPSPMAASTM